MEFSEDKHKAMNIRRHNLNCLHTLLGCKLTLSNYSGKKLGITVEISGQHIAAKKGSKMMIYIRNEIQNNVATCLWVCIVPSHCGICESSMQCHSY